MTVDSGAGATVVSDSMVKAVSAINPRPDIKYEVADGSHIPNMAERDFSAFTTCGSLRRITAQVTEVNKALLSVAKLVSSGHRAVLDPQLSPPTLTHRVNAASLTRMAALWSLPPALCNKPKSGAVRS